METVKESTCGDKRKDAAKMIGCREEEEIRCAERRE